MGTWHEMEDQRFGVRLVAAFDLLFPRKLDAFARFLVRLPRWLTQATEKEREEVRRLLEDRLTEDRTP